MEIEKDEFAPSPHPLVDATTAMDVFENAIRVYGVGNFAEYVGADYYGEFATDQLEHLKIQYKGKQKYTGTGSDYLDCVLGVGGFEKYGPIEK